MAIATINPATGHVVREFKAIGPSAIDQRLANAARAFSDYRLTAFDERSAWMRGAADILDSERDDVASMMTLEMGKTLTAARAEAEKCAKACRFYAEHAESMLADEVRDAAPVAARRAFVAYQPLGPVLAVMPWNFPLWQVMRFAAPALMAGNVGLLKHASNVPQTALFIEELFRRAGFPAGAFQTLLIESTGVERVLRDDRVRAVTLTGSRLAGAAVAGIAGSEVKPSLLELGGSDVFVVMPSADLQKAADVATTSRCLNNGQSCISAKRFVVHEQVADEFEALFVDRMSSQNVGDPTDADVDVGPLATEQGRADVEDLVGDAIAKGASVLCGGQRREGAGWYFPPTVMSGVTEDMRMYHEEVFGPVAQVHRAPNLDAAIRLANATEFGLGSNIWTNDPGEQQAFTRDVETGAVFVNGMTTSYPELPFGGVKASGYGRELSVHGIRAFCNAKTVWIS